MDDMLQERGAIGHLTTGATGQSGNTGVSGRSCMDCACGVGSKRIRPKTIVNSMPRIGWPVLFAGSVAVGRLLQKPVKSAFQRQILNGIDPLAAREAERRARKAALASRDFATAAKDYRAYMTIRGPDGTSEWEPSTAQEAEWIIRIHVNPFLGKLLVNDITVDHVYQCLEPIWYTKTPTARKARTYIEAILHREGRKGENNPATMRALEGKLKPIHKFYREEHEPALPYRQIGELPDELKEHSLGIVEFMKRLQSLQPPDRQAGRIAAKAFEFLILTTARTSMVRLAQWKHINFRTKLWTCPAFRDDGRQGHKTGKKTKQPYIIALSEPAIEILQEMKAWQDEQGIKSGPDDFVFVHGWPRHEWQRQRSIVRGLQLEARPLGQAWANSFLNDHMDGKKLINTEGKPGIVPHGFRTTFQLWAMEVAGCPNIIHEMALGHKVGGHQFGSYADWNAADRLSAQFRNYAGRDPYLLINARIQLQDAWALYCDGKWPPADNRDNSAWGQPRLVASN